MLPGGVGFAEGFRAQIPELSRIARCRALTPFRLDSSAMTPMHWIKLASVLAKNMGSFDGFVITHGTDTMAYTASALSFFLEGLRKPVILTGAQRPLSAIRSDARSNVLDAVEVATNGPPEVAICFGGLVLRGNRSRKRSLSDYRAFESPNFPPLGEVGTEVRLHREHFRKPRKRFKLNAAIDPRVLHLRLAPGSFGASLESIRATDARGVVLEAFGAGNLPVTEGEALAPLRHLVARGIPIVIISGSEHGAVDLGLYEGGRAARREGAISGCDMTAESAVVKLMVALSRCQKMSTLKSFIESDIAGELGTV